MRVISGSVQPVEPGMFLSQIFWAVAVPELLFARMSGFRGQLHR